MRDNIFIDNDTHKVISHDYLEVCEKVAQSFRTRMRRLSELMEEVNESPYIDDEVQDPLNDFYEAVKEAYEEHVRPFETQVCDALTYEDYLADREHEQFEIAKLRMEFDYPHQRAINRRY